MFDPAADPGRKVIRLVCSLTGKIPKQVWRPLARFMRATLDVWIDATS